MNAVNEPQNIARVAVIIPSRDGHRGGAVPRLLESIQQQTFRDFTVKLVIGVTPQGKGINQGVRETDSEIVLICDDDALLGDDTIFQLLVETLERDPKIGMAGASIRTPPGASPFQKRAAKQFPRFNVPVVEEVTDSDLACHGCCALRREVFEAVGGEREDIIRGLDPDLRQRLRAAGYRVVLAPHCPVYHPLPLGWTALMQTFFRNGYGSAYSWRFQRDSVFETHESLEDRGFNPRSSLLSRAVRFPFRLLYALITLRLMRLAAYSAYAVGYIYGLVAAREGRLNG